MHDGPADPVSVSAYSKTMQLRKQRFTRTKSTGVGGEQRGYYDGCKKVKGRKRHLLVDTQSLVLKAKVHSASIMGWDGIKMLLRQADAQFPRLKHLWLDNA